MNSSFSFESLRRDQPHEQRPLARVLRRVHGDHVLVHRELIPVALDDPADVVALERHREARKGADTELHDENVSGSR